LTTNKNEKLLLNFSDERDNFNLLSLDKLLTFTENVNNISSEIKALQRAVAMIKPEIRVMIREELARGIRGGGIPK
jgi:hypothetical protein